MLELRSKHVARFHHDVEMVWDIELDPEEEEMESELDYARTSTGDGSGEKGTSSSTTTTTRTGGRKRRTVMYQATSGTVFKQDPEQFEVRMEEFNIVELLADKSEGEGEGEGEAERKGEDHASRSTSTAPYGYKAIGLRTFVDARPVMERAGELQAQFAQGAA